MKRVFIVHRWDGSPQADWYPWLKSELEAKGFEVYVPAMPNSDRPEIKKWVSFLKKSVKNPDAETFFVGHSIGCQTIIRYLSSLKLQVGGVVFVAGFFKLTGLESDEEKSIAQPWLETEIKVDKAKQNIGKSVAIFSDDDPYVPMINMKLFKDDLGSDIIIEGHKGHFTFRDGATQLPIVRDEMLKMAKEGN